MAISGTVMTGMIRFGVLRHGTITALTGDGVLIPGTGIRGMGIPGFMATAIQRPTGCTDLDITIIPDIGETRTIPIGMDIIRPNP